MDIKHIIGLLVLVAVIFFGTVFMFVYKTSAPGPTENNSQNQVQTTGTTTVNSTTTVGAGTSLTPPTPDNEESTTPLAYQTCAAQKEREVAGRKYEKDSILVTFHDVMDFETALKTVEFLGLNADETLEARKNFRQNHWLEVTGIPLNSQFWIQCQIEEAEGVKRVSLNYLFSLRQ